VRNCSVGKKEVSERAEKAERTRKRTYSSPEATTHNVIMTVSQQGLYEVFAAAITGSLTSLGIPEALLLSLHSRFILFVRDRDFDFEVKLGGGLYRKLRALVPADPNGLLLRSDLGVVRFVSSPRDLCNLVLEDFEARQERNLIAHTSFNDAGILRLTSEELKSDRRSQGFLLCRECGKFLRGPTGLTSHMQRVHNIAYTEGMTGAKNQLSTFVVDVNSTASVAVRKDTVKVDDEYDDYSLFRLAQSATVEKYRLAIRQRVAEKPGFDIRFARDPHGSVALMWAAGGGNLELCKDLILQHGCQPSLEQRGKRSFKGRTALHWAARNGHESVVEFLLSERVEGVDIDAVTADGTNAFCWAAWGGHLSVMKLLEAAGCDYRR